MHLLLESLRESPFEGPQEQDDLEQLLMLAEQEHVLPWVAQRLQNNPSLSPGIVARLKSVEREATIAAFYWSSELEQLLRAFERNNLLVVPLKGPSLAERLYGDVALRVSHDLDLLVSRSDIARAESCLLELGFIPGAPDDYHRQWYRNRTTVELHYDVANPLAFDFGVAGALARVQRGSFQGTFCWLLAPADELVFLCLHAVRHRYERLNLVLDLCLAFERLSLPHVAGHTREMAERRTLLALGLAMAARLRPQIGAAVSLPVPADQAVHLEKVADRAWSRLLDEPAETLDWRALHDFYLEIEMPRDRPRRRWRHLRILLERVIEPDYEFAAKFGLERAWQVRALRPLRLLVSAIKK